MAALFHADDLEKICGKTLGDCRSFSLGVGIASSPFLLAADIGAGIVDASSYIVAGVVSGLASVTSRSASGLSGVFNTSGSKTEASCQDAPEEVFKIAPIGPRLVHSAFISSAAFSHDGRMVVTASYDLTARVWNPATGYQIASLSHPAKVLSAAFAADDKHVVTLSRDGFVRVWDIGAPSHPTYMVAVVPNAMRKNGSTIASAAISSDAKSVAFSTYDAGLFVSVLDDSNQSTAANIRWEEHVAEAIAFSPNGKRIAAGGGLLDGSVVIWDLRRPGTGPVMLRKFVGSVYAIAFSPDGNRLAVGTGDDVHVWNLQQQIDSVIAEDRIYEAHGIAFGPDGKHIAAVYDGKVQVWDLNDPVRIAATHAEPFTDAVAFSPNDNEFVTGSDDVHIEPGLAYAGARIWQICP